MKPVAIRAALAGRTGMVTLLFAISLLATGCPFGDPDTSSVITNDTSGVAEIELVLDRGLSLQGFDDEERAEVMAERGEAWAREILDEFVSEAYGNEGVTLISVDGARLAGVFEVAPSGKMILEDSLGNEPWIRWSEMAITTETGGARYVGKQEILDHLIKVDDDFYANFYELLVSSVG